MRRFAADLIMIASSSGAITEAKAREYASDIELLAKEGYLKKVDLTLLNGLVEIRAVTYEVNTESGDLSMSRPGGVLWPRILNPTLRVVLSYTGDYTTEAREKVRRKLRINWVPTNADTSHSSLSQSGGRDYTSNGWGMQRKDYGE